MVGVDIAEIARIKKAVKSDAFVSRVFTASERAYCEGKPCRETSYAGIFCAKEAAAKALGCGFSGGVAPTDFEVVHDGNGAPALKVSGVAASLAENCEINISISHDGAYAVAMVEIIKSR